MVATVSVTAQEYYPESAEEQYAAEFIPVEQDDAADDSLVAWKSGNISPGS